VGGFLRYVQFRDQHTEPEKDGLDAYVRYVAYRDRTSPGGRVFGPEQDGMEIDRRRLVDYISRSTKGLAPTWVKGADGNLADQERATYQMILSPEDWRGLDLRRLARAAMKQLEEDAGTGGIGPWLGAEHRNTAHHHVHIVLAARRELKPGKFQTLLITRNRLQRMKEAVGQEIDRQRGLEIVRDEKAATARLSTRGAPRQQSHVVPRWRRQRVRPSFGNLPSRSIRHDRGNRLFGTALLRLRGAALGYHRQMVRELEDENARREREGWVR
jgi:hypothetical protein